MDQFVVAARKYKILIVDDNDTYRNVVKKTMELSGFEVADAVNGQLGLNLAKQFHPELMLVDIYMPVMDGMMLLSELKKDPNLSKIPVVMVTNVQEELDGAVKAGAEEAVLKSSVTPHQIIEICLKHLAEKQNVNLETSSSSSTPPPPNPQT